MAKLCKQIMYLIVTFWHLKAKEDWTKAIVKLKAMKILSECHRTWPSQLIEDRTQLILKMRRKKMTLTTTFWRNQNFSKATLSRTTCSAIQQTSLCGLSMGEETLAAWVLMLQPCTRQDRSHSADQAMLTLKRMEQSRRVSSSSGRGQAGIVHLFQVTSPPCLSRLKTVTILLEVMVRNKIIFTGMVRLSKFDRIYHRKRHSLQLCTFEGEFILLEDTMPMIRCNWTYVSTMTWSRIDGKTRPSNTKMEQLSTNCTSQDLRAAAVSLMRLLSMFSEGIAVILARYHALRNLISPRRQWSRWTSSFLLLFAVLQQSRYQQPRFFWLVDLERTVKSLILSFVLILTRILRSSSLTKLIVQAWLIAQSFWIKWATFISS